MEKSERQLSRRRGPWTSVLVTVALAIAGVGVAQSSGQRAVAIPAVVNAVRQARQGAPVPGRLFPRIATIKIYPSRYRISRDCRPQDDQLLPARRCRVGDVASRKVIVLLGDSHAYMWAPALQVMAKRDGWAVVPLLRFGCTPEKWFTSRGPDGPICRAWLRWAFSEVERLHPTVTLVAGSVGETPSPQASAAAAGVIEAARRLERIGRTIVIGDPEGLSSNPVRCLSDTHATLARCMTTWPTSALAGYNAVARATASMGIGFLRTRGFVCHEHQCPAVVGHTIVWMDTNHLTGLYSAQLAPEFRAEFRRLMG